MNIRMIDGRLMEDAKIRTTKNNDEFLSFTFIHNRRKNGQDEGIKFNVVSYDTRVINNHKAKNFYTKGRPLNIFGSCDESITERDGKYYLNRNIVAYYMEFPISSNLNRDEHGQNSSLIDNGVVKLDTYARVPVAAPAPTQPVQAIPSVQAPMPSPSAPVVVETPTVSNNNYYVPVINEAEIPLPTKSATVTESSTGVYTSLDEDDLPF